MNSIQRSAKVFVRGCEKFVIALAYLFCLALVGSCLARFAYFLAGLCTRIATKCGQGGQGVQKSVNLADIICEWSPKIGPSASAKSGALSCSHRILVICRRQRRESCGLSSVSHPGSSQFRRWRQQLREEEE